MKIEWHKLRAFNGDIKYAFEELVCQLARAEEFSGRREFHRLSAPDAGVEAYCVLENGQEYGWQAKFFDSFGDKQWTQIENSFMTAFSKHLNLVRYYVCVPIDRSDPRVKDQKWSMDKWNEKTVEWKAFAQDQGRKIEFIYWGSSEIFDRLSKKDNQGKYSFWFGAEEFTDEWFSKRLCESISNLDVRYTPEINVSLPIVKIFDGLSRDERLKETCTVHVDDLLRKSSSITRGITQPTLLIEIEAITSLTENLKTLFAQIEFSKISIEIWNTLANILDGITAQTSEVKKKLYDLKKTAKDHIIKKNDDKQSLNDPSYEIRKVEGLDDCIDTFKTFIKSPSAQLSYNPVLVITGNAGVGKSHLLADIAMERKSRNLPTIMLLGQQFNNDEPWSQISKRLQTTYTGDKLLGALDSLGEAIQSRVLIFIDAINEGYGRHLWPDNLPALLQAIGRFSNLGVVLSVRSSYKELLIPETLIKSKGLVVVTHNGFSNHEYDALKIFFSNYKIKQPGIPLLHPEFSNPLFLKLFCQGLHGKGLSEIPAGYEGITAILDFYLENINEKISNKHAIPRKLKIVQKVIRQFASYYAESNYLVEYDKGYKYIINLEELAAISNKIGFFEDLISEGILTQNLSWSGAKELDCLYLAYDRFSDHLICEHYLGDSLADKNPYKLFAPGSKLYSFIKDEFTCNFNRGIIDSLSIQLPERFGFELFELAPHTQNYEDVIFSAIDSIAWRARHTMGEPLLKYITEHLDKSHFIEEHFINTILLITSNPEHFFNSDFLHKHLSSFSMPDRDAWWNESISHKYYYSEPHVIKRLIDWAWSPDEKDNIPCESVRLISQTLIWFLAGSDNGLRDAATKSLVNLLQSRPGILIDSLKRFEKIDDPYITQRLYAVALGCALRSDSMESLKLLADYVITTFFNDEYVHPDILARDYARSIVEYAITKGYRTTKNIRPPYKSEWLDNLPSFDELKGVFEGRAFNYLTGSVLDGGDFSRYIIGTNSNHSSWRGLKFGESKKDRGKLFNDFCKNLNTKQRKYWKQMDPLIKGKSKPFGPGFSGIKIRLTTVLRRRTEEEVEKASVSFESCLTEDQKNFYLTEIKPFLNHNREIINDTQSFDLRIAQRYILNRVLDLGWHPDKHGRFDEGIGHPYGNDRKPKRVERIAKKYQWIAYYEFLAKLADNYQFKEGHYQGPWEPFLRDIDPTTTLRNQKDEKLFSFWWTPQPYGNWKIPDQEWIEDTSDFPDPGNLIQTIDPSGNEWLVLESDNFWNQPTEIGKDQYDSPHKHVWYQLKSYIVPLEDHKRIVNKLKGKNFANNWMPSSNSRYEVFHREYYWAPACESYRSENYPEYNWSEIITDDIHEFIGSAFITTNEYSSSEDHLHFYMPSEILFTLMNLKHGKIEGEMVNEKGEVVCFDPSASKPSKSLLLVRKDYLQNMLEANGLSIFWTRLGRKEIIGHAHLLRELTLSGITEYTKNKLESTARYFK